jgi:hypothetical protein
MKIENNRESFHEKMFDFIINIAFVLLIMVIFGFSQYALKYLESLDYYIKIYIALYLIWRFNPLRSKYEFTSLDVKIAFNSGLFILASTALLQYLKTFAVNTTKELQNVSIKEFKKIDYKN